MIKTPNFETLLPNTRDPVKAKFRSKLVYVLNSQGEILPPANSLIGKLWRLVNSPDASTQDCQELIELDPTLTARIFRVANSAAYGLKANTISEAIFNLGFKAVREMVFNASVFSQFKNLAIPEGWELFWLRNLFVARLTERIAAVYIPTDGSQYLAGLVHDVGLLFMAVKCPEELAAVINAGKPLVQAEKELLPFGHAEIGAAIAARSLLPLTAINGILYHHRNLPAGETLLFTERNPQLLAVILRLADKAADACQLTLFGATVPTLEDLLQSEEIALLNRSGHDLPLEAFIGDELPKAQEIYQAFFEN